MKNAKARGLVASLLAKIGLTHTHKNSAQVQTDPPMDWILSDAFEPQRGKSVHEIYQEFLKGERKMTKKISLVLLVSMLMAALPTAVLAAPLHFDPCAPDHHAWDNLVSQALSSASHAWKSAGSMPNIILAMRVAQCGNRWLVVVFRNSEFTTHFYPTGGWGYIKRAVKGMNKTGLRTVAKYIRGGAPAAAASGAGARSVLGTAGRAAASSTTGFTGWLIIPRAAWCQQFPYSRTCVAAQGMQ